MTIETKLAAALQAVGRVQTSAEADTGKYKYRYAKLGDVITAVNAALNPNGLTWSQVVMPVGEQGQQITTKIIDCETGEFLALSGPVFRVPNDPQAIGSALTYMRRYALVTAFGIIVEDDDGGVAHREVTQPGQRTPAEKEVRAFVAKLPDAMAKEEFQHAFVEEFGCTLTNLPESKHGDALTWTKEYEKGLAK